MSGGHFDYKQFELQKLADEIEQLALENATQDWTILTAQIRSPSSTRR